MRLAAHKGQPAAQRIMAVPAGAVPIEAELPPGVPLLDALAALLDMHGVESAALTLSGGGFGPFAYVMPALSPDGSQVAFYSETFRPEGLVLLQAAAVTVGFKDGSPFFHCHGVWTEAAGMGCGHVLPAETVVALPITVRGAGIVGARFAVTPDAETGFSLFMPSATGTPPPAHARPALALRLAPNQDLVGALEQAGREAGFRRAVVHGGVASINEARFTDAPPLRGFATELLVRRGLLRCAPEHGNETALFVTVVDYTGAIGGGRLVAGDNPVLMTFEGVLEGA